MVTTISDYFGYFIRFLALISPMMLIAGIYLYGFFKRYNRLYRAYVSELRMKMIFRDKFVSAISGNDKTLNNENDK